MRFYSVHNIHIHFSIFDKSALITFINCINTRIHFDEFSYSQEQTESVCVLQFVIISFLRLFNFVVIDRNNEIECIGLYQKQHSFPTEFSLRLILVFFFLYMPLWVCVCVCFMDLM